MTCRSPWEAADLLGPAACGALDVEERARLALHLADCRDCREELLALRRVVRQLSVLKQALRAR
jgi:anti-sigma factor RsiW